jgi:hypothetical protein
MKQLLTLLALAALVFVSACGGDDDDSEATPGSNVEGTPTTVPTPTPTLPPLRPDFTPDASTPGTLPTPDEGAITVDEPAPEAEIESPVLVRGRVTEAAGARVIVTLQTNNRQELASQAVDVVDGEFEVELVFNGLERPRPGAIRVIGESTGSGLTRPRGGVGVTIAEGLVYVSRPDEEDRSISPLTVSGSARAPGGKVYGRLLGSAGELLGEGEADAPEGPERSDFSFDIPFTVSNNTPAQLEVYARDGDDEVGLFTVMVTLLPGMATPESTE